MSATRDIGPAVGEITLTANIYREENQYIAQCVEFSAVGQGDTPAQAVDDLKVAAELYLEVFPDAMKNPRLSADDLVKGVRELEQAYANVIGEPVEPVDICFVDKVTFSFSPDHA